MTSVYACHRARSFILVVGFAGLLLSSLSAQPPQRTDDQSWNRYVKGAGEYQVVMELSGRIEITRALRRPDPLNLTAICEAKREAEKTAIGSASSYLLSLEKALDQRRFLPEIVRLQNELGQLYSYRGDMPEAIRHFEGAYRSLLKTLADHPEYDESRLAFEEIIGVAQMRRGELENCVANHNAEMCLFPLRAAAQHKLKSGSSLAIEYFRKYLSQRPENLEVRWLLNLAYMTLGEYPAGVPPRLLINFPNAPASDRLPRFPEVAASLGIDPVMGAGGSIVDDFDNDGNLDILISSVDACESLRYFHNSGDGTFGDWTERAGLSNQSGGINCVQTDYDNDGWLDIFVMRGGWEFPMRNSLLRNNQKGGFTDVTAQSGLLSGEHRTHSASWADYDNDGWLDVFIGHEESPSQLFHNNRDGTFSDVSTKAGVGRTAFTKGVTWGDYDNDGLEDLYLSNYGSENFLYHNNGDGTFTEVAKKLGVEKPIMSFPTWFFDYDNDGWLDLFVSSFVPSVAEVARGYLGLPPTAETIKLYRNNGRGGFEDVTNRVGLNKVFPAMGANFGDLDNDGFPDFYLGTGAPSYAALVPNVMFRNRLGKSFIDITSATGTGHLQKGHGVAFGDIDNDGDEDLYVNVGGFVPGDRYNKALFLNPTNNNGNRWLSVKLRGTRSNRAAIGAKVKVTLRMPNGVKTLRYQEVSSGGSFGASPLTRHFGLGKAIAIESLQVVWPGEKSTQTYRNVAMNGFIEVIEGEPGAGKRELKTLHLTGAPSVRHH